MEKRMVEIFQYIAWGMGFIALALLSYGIVRELFLK